MREIKLTQGYMALVDNEDFERLNYYKWRVSISSNMIYAVTGSRKNLVRMHNMLLHSRVNQEINHKNYDGLDNRKENFEYTSRSANVRHGRCKLGRSGHRNISWNKDTSKWQVQFYVYSQFVYGGRFERLGAAIEARDKLLEEYNLRPEQSINPSTEVATHVQ